MFISVLLFSIGCLSQIQAAEVARVEIDTQSLADGERIDLNGYWWFTFGEQIDPSDIRQLIAQQQMDFIFVPQAWNDVVELKSDDPYQHGVATYALPLRFDQKPQQALSLYVSYVVGGYRLYWLADNATEAVVLGSSGEWVSGEQHSEERQVFHLPAESDGLVIFHVAKKHIYAGGIRHPISIQRTDALQHSIAKDSTVRSILIGGMLIMAVHYFIQFCYSPANRSLLLLSILCLGAVLRGVCTAGYIELFLSDYIPFSHILRIKLEYMSVLFMPVVYFVFLSSILPKVVPKSVIRFAIYSLVMGMIITLVVSTSFTSKALNTYQLYFLFWSIAILFVIFYGVITKVDFAKLTLISTLIVAIGGANDIIASRSSFYNVYLAEYVFFIFLFFQAQIVGLQMRAKLKASLQLYEEKKQLEQAHNKALFVSHQDHLTGLHNRLALTEQLSQYEANNYRSIGVILCDLDHFKQINDTYGHDVGDEILIFVASLLHGHAFRANDFKCRYGGEEFLIILPDANLQKTKELAEELRSKLEKAIAYSDDNVSLKVTASMGVAVQMPRQSESLKNVIKRADNALYRAKANGRNCIAI